MRTVCRSWLSRVAFTNRSTFERTPLPARAAGANAIASARIADTVTTNVRRGVLVRVPNRNTPLACPCRMPVAKPRTLTRHLAVVMSPGHPRSKPRGGWDFPFEERSADAEGRMGRVIDIAGARPYAADARVITEL
jgi:hypothetical protein